MAYQFADGFDNYGNTFTFTNGYPWDNVIGGSVSTSTADLRFTPPGSTPGACLTVGAGGATGLTKNLVNTPGTLIVGFGFKTLGLPTTVADILGFEDTGTGQVSLVLNTNGQLQFYSGIVGSPIGAITASSTIVANQWYGIVVQVVFATAGGGSVQLYLNGNPVASINSTSLTTSQTAHNYATQVTIGHQTTTSGGATHYDDFFCYDTTGAFLNSLPGSDVRIITKLPSGAGNYTNWTPNGLGSNWQNGAVTPPNITDFNANNVALTKDSYATQVTSLSVAPFFVVARASMERDDAGPHTPSLFVRSGSADSVGMVTPALTSSYAFYDAIFQNDPNTGAVWTGPGADNAQVGVIEG